MWGLRQELEIKERRMVLFFGHLSFEECLVMFRVRTWRLEKRRLLPGHDRNRHWLQKKYESGEAKAKRGERRVCSWRQARAKFQADTVHWMELDTTLVNFVNEDDT